MIQNHVTSRKLSQALYDAGIVLDTVFYWYEISRHDDNDKQYIVGQKNEQFIYGNGGWKQKLLYPAPMSSELGEMLPCDIQFMGKTYFLSLWKRLSGEYGVIYKTNQGRGYFPARIGSMSEAMVKTLLYLVKEGIVTVESLKKEEV